MDPLSRCASTSHPNASSGHVLTESGRVGTHTAHSAATGRCEEPAERDAPRAIFPQVLGFLKLHARVVLYVARNMGRRDEDSDSEEERRRRKERKKERRREDVRWRL